MLKGMNSGGPTGPGEMETANAAAAAAKNYWWKAKRLVHFFD
jgi:hypothetical protein